MKIILKYFLEAANKFRKQFFKALAMISLLTATEVLIPLMLRYFLNRVIVGPQQTVLLVGILLFSLFLLLQVFLNIARFAELDQFGGRYLEYMTGTLQDTMANTTYSEIEKKEPEIIRNILYTDTLNVFRTIGHCLPSMIGALIVLAASLLFAFFYNYRIALYISAAILAGLLLSWCSRQIIAKYAGQTNQKLKRHDAWCSQFIRLLPLIQTNNILPYFQEQNAANIQDFIATSIQEDRKIYFWTGVVNGYHTLFSIILSALLALPAAKNSAADFMFFTMLANIALHQSQQIVSLFQQIMRYYVSFEHVESLRRMPQRPDEAEASEIREIRCEDVSYAYPNGVPGIRDVHFAVNAGDIVHLKGQNGSGKSTLLKLLAGLYAADTGAILLNGVPSVSYSQQSLNAQILYVSQDEQCLNESFRRYLEIIANETLSVHTYQELIDQVGLPDDDRTISGNGASLSDGQRKKLFLIKTLLRQKTASVLILDEITAGLDRETAEHFYHWLAEFAHQNKKIVFVIDHALPDGIANRVLSFADGKVTCDK